MRRYDELTSPGNERPSPRGGLTASLSLALLLSAFAVHLFLFQRAKRHLGF